MKTQKEQLIESLNCEMEKYQRLLEKVERIPVQLFAEAFPNGRWTNFWGSSFEFALPFDFKLINQVKVFVSMQFPEFVLSRENQFVWDTSKSAGHFLEYETQEDSWRDRVTFQVAFRTEKEGTTCVLNQVGKKEVPVYEVICKDGASENSF